MKTLLVNPAWDAAGVSIQQCKAINKYTNWKARHFRAVPTFNYETDLVGERYNKDEFVQLAKDSDVIHFCSCPHTYKDHFDFGIDWSDIFKNKIVILHDYAFFEVRWTSLRDSKELWNRKEQLGYDDIWSSLPQGNYIFKDCYYMPDIVNENEDIFNNTKSFNNIILGHFPTGGSNRKNTNELNLALAEVRNAGICLETIIKSGVSNIEILNIRKRMNLGFDALWRGFHGMTTVENLAMGVPTMVNIEPEFIPIFKECFNSDFFPFEQVATVDEIKNTIIKYAKNLEELKHRSNEVKSFMINNWSSKNIANKIVNRYEYLLSKK